MMVSNVKKLGIAVLLFASPTLGLALPVIASGNINPASAIEVRLEPTSAITVTEPNGVGDKVAESDDFATTVLGDPWDMNQPTDLKPTGPANNPGHGFRNVSFSNGIFEGVTLSNDSGLWLHHQGIPETNNIDLHNGLAYPIDAAKYTLLTFRMYREDDNRDVPIRIYWYKAGDEVTGQPSGMSAPILPHAGWYTYVVDLSDPAKAAAGSWTGQVTGLRLDPISTNYSHYYDKLVRLDWVRLTKPQRVEVSVDWQDNISTNGQAVMAVLLDDDNNIANGVVRAMGQTMATAGAGSYAIDTQGMPPGAYYVHGMMGTDYAGLVRRDPWDFRQVSDYNLVGNFANVTVSDSLFRGTTSTRDPWIWMAIPGNEPVDASVFRYLAIRIFVTAPANGVPPFMNMLWTRKGDSSPWQSESSFYTLTPGWNNVLIDLAASASRGSWSGLITDLRVDPVTEANVNVQIDWLALLTANQLPAAEANLTPATGTSAGAFVINQAPIAKITAPSMESGDDYATTVLGQPWDFRSANTVYHTAEIVNAVYSSNGMDAYTSGTGHAGCPDDCGDAQVWLRVSPDPSKYIDAERFKYVTIRYRQEGEQNVFAGWATRLLWTPSMFPTNQSTLDDVIPHDGWPTYGPADGWYTYQYDLTKMRLEPDGAIPGQNNWGWNNTYGKIAQFRFDPTELPTVAHFQIDKVLLTADPVSTGSTTIRWQIQNPDDAANVSLYAVDVARAADRLLIGNVSQAATSFVWDTSSVAQGNYRIVMELNDGYNATSWTSQVPIVVRQPLSINVSEPNGVNDRLVRAPEFATDVLGNAWDMDAAYDLDMRLVHDVTAPTFDQGILSMTSTGSDPYLWLNWDLYRPIDASVYRNLCVRMHVSQPSQGEVIWYDQNEQALSSGQFLALPGWRDYRFTLNSYTAWSGWVRRLRIDPVFASNIQIEIDGVKLTNPTGAGYTVRWTAGGAADAKVSLFYNTTGSLVDGTLLAADLPAQAGSATIDTSCLEPGEYYIVARIDDGASPTRSAISPGKLVIAAEAQGVSVTPAALVILVEKGGSRVERQLTIDAFGLGSNWRLTGVPNMPWIALNRTSGVGFPAQFTISATPNVNVPLGEYVYELGVVIDEVEQVTIPLRIHVVDELYGAFLPMVRRN